MKLRRQTFRAVTAALLLFGASGALVAGQARPGRADTVTNSNDALRDGWYPDESVLSPATVTGGGFGQIFSASVDGQVYAQPLVANGTLLVATENNKVYGLDPQTGATQWTRSLGTPFNAADNGCADLAPHIGVTGTPTVDPATNTAYFLDKQYANGVSGTPIYVAHAVNVTSGAEVAGWPITIQGFADNAPHNAAHLFDATQQLQRPGLLLMDGVVYAAFGSSCDSPVYRGWIVGLSTTNASITTMFTTMVSDQSGAGIWQSGSGLVSDVDGQILFSTGNGGFSLPGPVPGNQPPANLSEAVARVVVQPDGTLKPVDFFAPYDSAALETNDLDFGSGGPVALPDQYFGTASHPHLLVIEGKQGYVYLLDRDNLGGYLQGPGGGDGSLGRVGPYGGVWSRPAVWPGDGGYVYVVTANGSGGSGAGTSGFMRAYQYGTDGSANPTLSLVASTTDTFGFGSGAPVVTSNGTASGSALLWDVWEPDGSGANAQLRAYDPVPANGTFNLKWSAPIGTASKFSMPAVDGGHVYVGTRDGHVRAFSAPVSQPLAGAIDPIADTTVGQSTTVSATFTARQTTTVTGFSSANAAFTLGSPTPAVPVQLNQGDSISVPVTFTPTKSGGASTTLQANTASDGSVSIGASANGVSAAAQLNISPAQLSLGGTTAGGDQLSGTVTVSDIGAGTLNISGTDVPAPGSGFSVTGAPGAGTTVAGGGSLAMTVTFSAPPGAATGPYQSQLTVHSDGGDKTVILTAEVAQGAKVDISPGSFSFTVGIGGTVDSTFVLHNSGGLSALFVRSKPPAHNVGFRALTALPEGTSLPAGGSLTERVRFTATRLGTFTDTWSLNPADGLGVRNVAFTAHVVSQHGYWMLGSDGTVYPFGSAVGYGNAPDPTVTHLTPTPSARGYWIVNASGQVRPFGDAHWYGNAVGLRFGERVTTMSATSTGHGYWLFTSAGAIFTFGDARFYGDLRALTLNGPIIDSVPTASAGGYYLVASDGGVFAFGDARFHGSLGARRLNRPVIGLVPTATGNGYWLVASDGGVFAFGDAPFRGSLGALQLNRPIVGMVRFGNGYLVAGSDGGVFDFSSSPFFGSLGGRVPASPIIGIAAFDR